MADSSDLLNLIAQFEAEREELDTTIALLRRRAGLTSSGDNGGTGGPAANHDAGRDTPVVAGRVRSDEFFRLSISDAIAKYLSIMKQPQNPMAIVNGLKAGGVLTNAKNFYANVNTELKRMRARDQIVNTPSGWGLSDWYPQRPKQAETPKPKKGKKKPAKSATAKTQPKTAKKAAPKQAAPKQAAPPEKDAT